MDLVNTFGLSYRLTYMMSEEELDTPVDPNAALPVLPDRGFLSGFEISWRFSNIHGSTYGVSAEQGGSLPEDHPANYVMFVLASMDDPGCLILPYYRALAKVDLSTVLDAWSGGTALAPYVIERMSDHDFRQWTRAIIFTISGVYIGRAAWLGWQG